MKTVGLPISHKENEKRRTLLPKHAENISNRNLIYIEQNYGEVLGIDDKEYIDAGFKICSREEALSKDIICDPKVGDAEYLDKLKGQTIFGWIHAVQNSDITDKIIKRRLTGYAWEDMYEDGRHSFWRNNEIAGEAAIIHAFMCHGVMPYHNRVAVLGRGNIAKGAVKILHYYGADVTIYDRRTEYLLSKEIGQYDIVVNAILWDTKRTDHIIYKADLARMKRGSMIIDISCDRNGGVETSRPTTIKNPIYNVDGVAHYVVDHTPTLFWKTTSESLSLVFSKFIDQLITGQIGTVLKDANNFTNGQIIDRRIIEFQNR